ncbi:hypothetical protein [Zavarzinella formosa]|uniref:hypothetical protein n=1 Tax=Zavarzinella formosa TaxID=360055 RepID=UPI00030DA25F|nr:hypothetical protein [Zavarzinella formosa]
MKTHIIRILVAGLPVLLTTAVICQIGMWAGPKLAMATPVKETPTETERAPRTAVEHAVGRLELTFFQGQAKRTISGIKISSGKDTLFVTAGSACVVPDGVPPAIDIALMEVPEKLSVRAAYDPRSTSELFVYHVPGLASRFQVNAPATIGVGDAMSVVRPNEKGQLRVILNACAVKAVSRTGELKLPNGSTKKFENLVEIDHRFPEGTPLISGDRLVGIVVIGTRFGAEGETTSLATPADRIQELTGQNAPGKK